MKILDKLLGKRETQLDRFKKQYPELYKSPQDKHLSYKDWDSLHRSINKNNPKKD